MDLNACLNRWKLYDRGSYEGWVPHMIPDDYDAVVCRAPQEALETAPADLIWIPDGETLIIDTQYVEGPFVYPRALLSHQTVQYCCSSKQIFIFYTLGSEKRELLSRLFLDHKKPLITGEWLFWEDDRIEHAPKEAAQQDTRSISEDVDHEDYEAMTRRKYSEPSNL